MAIKKEHNFKIDFSNRKISIEVSSEIFPIPVILRAAYHFIDEAKVIAEKGKKDKVIVTLIPEHEFKESDLENLAYEFNIQLISSFLEEEESRKHAGVRDAMMKAALLPQLGNIPQQPKSERKQSFEEKPKN
jgi:His-Xaa-Ser system protein HxsD